jgi:hypothetical protein
VKHFTRTIHTVCHVPSSQKKQIANVPTVITHAILRDVFLMCDGFWIFFFLLQNIAADDVDEKLCIH